VLDAYASGEGISPEKAASELLFNTLRAQSRRAVA
jgi:hypothetical protein